MIVVYVAGPFRGPSAWDIEQNVREAETLALEVWRTPGCCAICPHANTRFFQHAAPDEVWLSGDLEILRRCDAMILTPRWRESSGARGEVEAARSLGLPVFEDLAALCAWVQGRQS